MREQDATRISILLAQRAKLVRRWRKLLLSAHSALEATDHYALREAIAQELLDGSR